MSKEKKLHFNFIDVLVIICFAILICGFAFYATGNWQTNHGDVSSNQNTVKYVITAEDISPQVAESISVGDELKDSAKETVKGKITKIISDEKFKESVFNSETGEFVLSEHPINHTVVLEIESSCVFSGETAVIDDTEVKVGTYLHLKTPKYAIGSYITAVEKVKGVQ